LQLKGVLDGEPLGSIGMAPIIAGTVSAGVVGFFAIKFMLRIVKNRSLRGFALYVSILGVLVLVDQYALHLFFK
jgi:undecaprenyl-diphosphatase